MVGAGAAPRRGPPSVTLVVSDAVAYLESLPSGSVDGVLAAYLLRNVPDRARLVAEVARVLRPGGAVVHPRLLGGRQHPRPGDLGRGVPRHHHPARRGEALRRAAAPLPLHQRARLRLGRAASASACWPPAWSTSGTGRSPGGSTASCTPSPGRRRRDPGRARAGRPASTDGPSSTRRRAPVATTDAARVPASARHVVVVGGGIAGLTAALGAGRARRAGHRARARGAARRPGAVVAGRARPTASTAR